MINKENQSNSKEIISKSLKDDFEEYEEEETVEDLEDRIKIKNTFINNYKEDIEEYKRQKKSSLIFFVCLSVGIFCLLPLFSLMRSWKFNAITALLFGIIFTIRRSYCKRKFSASITGFILGFLSSFIFFIPHKILLIGCPILLTVIMLVEIFAIIPDRIETTNAVLKDEEDGISELNKKINQFNKQKNESFETELKEPSF